MHTSSRWPRTGDLRSENRNGHSCRQGHSHLGIRRSIVSTSASFCSSLINSKGTSLTAARNSTLAAGFSAHNGFYVTWRVSLVGAARVDPLWSA
jgi:hypothetical protein